MPTRAQNSLTETLRIASGQTSGQSKVMPTVQIKSTTIRLSLTLRSAVSVPVLMAVWAAVWSSRLPCLGWLWLLE